MILPPLPPPQFSNKIENVKEPTKAALLWNPLSKRASAWLVRLFSFWYWTRRDQFKKTLCTHSVLMHHFPKKNSKMPNVLKEKSLLFSNPSSSIHTRLTDSVIFLFSRSIDATLHRSDNLQFPYTCQLEVIWNRTTLDLLVYNIHPSFKYDHWDFQAGHSWRHSTNTSRKK